MIYKNRCRNSMGDEYYEISHRGEDTKNILDTYGDWDEFMIRFPHERMSSLLFDSSMDIPENVMTRVALIRGVENIENQYANILECKIREILQSNSFPDDVLDALPEYINFAEFTSERFLYSYKDGETSKDGLIVDSIMQWYREPEEGPLSCSRDEFGNWKSIEKP